MNSDPDNILMACVIGRGHIGNKICVLLEELNIKYISIDPLKADASYRLIEDIPERVLEKLSHCFICVPTVAHFQVLCQITALKSKVHVMMEKPLVLADEIPKFKNFQNQTPGLNVFCNNHYEECENLINATEIMQELNMYPNFIDIDFAKHRGSDIKIGRYVDDNYKLWGYEGHHMVYIVSKLLSAEDSQDFLSFKGKHAFSQGPNGHVSWVCERTVLPSGCVVILRTSTDGSTKEWPATKLLKNGQRKRQAICRLRDGLSLKLIFGSSASEEFKSSDEFALLTSHNTKYFGWVKSNPLKSHIQKFLTSSLNSNENLATNLIISKRLRDMTLYTYSSQMNVL